MIHMEILRGKMGHDVFNLFSTYSSTYSQVTQKKNNIKYTHIWRERIMKQMGKI